MNKTKRNAYLFQIVIPDSGDEVELDVEPILDKLPHFFVVGIICELSELSTIKQSII